MLTRTWKEEKIVQLACRGRVAEISQVEQNITLPIKFVDVQICSV